MCSPDSVFSIASRLSLHAVFDAGKHSQQSVPLMSFSLYEIIFYSFVENTLYREHIL